MGRPRKEISQGNLERFNKELEMAGGHTELLLQDKKGRSRSCLLCKRRKQKCDHKQPSCTTCLKAAVKCIQPARYNLPLGDITDGTPSPLSSGYVGSTISPAAQPPKTLKTTATGTHFSSDSGGGDGISVRSSLSSGHSVTGSPDIKSMSIGGDAFRLSPVEISALDKPQQAGQSEKPKESYVISLEKKIKTLEKMLAMQRQSPGEPTDSSMETVMSAPVTAKTTNILPLPSSAMKGNFLPLKKPIPNASDGPFNMVSSPGKATILPSLASDSLNSVEFLKCIFAKYNLREFLDYDPAFRFEEEVSRSLLETFFCRLQFKYPLLDEDEIYRFHDDYIKSNIYSYTENGFHFACGRLWLVFSVSACLSMTTGKYKGEPPVRYFSRAIRHITRCGENLTYVQQVELLTLLVLYILRTDRDSLVLYDIIRDAMLICKEKLHLNVWQPEDAAASKNLRLFWCVYLLERMICVAVGRPYTISETEIDLPLFDEVSFNTRSMNDPKRQHRGVHFINQSLRLRRIESHFVEKLRILPESQIRKQAWPEQLLLVKKFFHDLEVWRANCSKNSVRNFENETLKLYYYRSVRLLIQPYLEFLAPEDRLFRECQAAAGQICQLFKIFHQKTVTGHSTPAVHTVFIAGVTLIYCMWLARNNYDQRRKTLGDDSKHTRPLVSASLFSTMDDLRACSVSLYVMAERSNFARIFRDTFDQLMNATVGNLIERCGPDSSELIYVSPLETHAVTDEEGRTNSSQESGKGSEEGMPPATNRIFGTRQAEELAGFVENSQVDLEEQKELKKKQGALQQKSVPESLSHFLIKSDGNNNTPDGEKNTPQVFEEDQIYHRPSLRKRRSSMGGSESTRVDDNQYIVKKPTHSKEFDWKTFQHQAFLQQHNAQQNLQAYLSSLNPSSKPAQAVDGIKSIPDIEKNLSIGPSSGYVLSEIKQLGTHDSSADIVRPEGPLGPSASAGPQNSALASLLGPEQNSVLTNQTLPPNETRTTASCITAKPVAKLFTGKEADATTTILNANILLSNGAQGMINDISTWTTDSVTHLINENMFERDISLERNDIIPVSKRQLGANELLEHSQTKLQPGFDSKKQALDPAIAYPQGGPLGFLPSPSNLSIPGAPVTASEHSKQGNNLDSRTLKLPPPTAKDFVVEEFWTVNDDYGFLT